MSRSSTNLVALAHWMVMFDIYGSLALRWCCLASVSQLHPAGVHGWLQVAAIETAVSESDIVASSTCSGS